jgi:hypothetical protein
MREYTLNYYYLPDQISLPRWTPQVILVTHDPLWMKAVYKSIERHKKKLHPYEQHQRTYVCNVRTV